jgi:restriction endonuclease S subunit
VTKKALKRVVKLIPGQSPSSREVSRWDGSEVPFLQGNAEFGQEHPSPVQQCDPATRICREGDILLSVRAPVGALNLADRSYGIGRGLCAIRPESIDPRFAWWLLNAKVGELQSKAVGSTYDAVTAEDVGSLVVSIPDTRRQRAIADFLDRETARIDALITRKRHLALHIADRHYNLRQRMILADLDPTTGDGYLPTGWTRARLGVLLELQRGVDLPTDARAEGFIPVVSSGGISGWHDRAAAQGPGVVTGRYGTVGEVFFVDSDYWPLNTTLYVKDFPVGRNAALVSHPHAGASTCNASDEIVAHVNMRTLQMSTGLVFHATEDFLLRRVSGEIAKGSDYFAYVQDARRRGVASP